MDAELLTHTHKRLEALLVRIYKVRKRSTRLELLNRSIACTNIRNLISKELVECRRTRKVTSKCQTLIESYIHSVDLLEEYVTFGLLVDA